MANKKNPQNPGELPFDLKDVVGQIKQIQEFIPGVYYLSAQREDCGLENYYVVMESAGIFAAVSRYGRQFPGLRLYALSEGASGWRIVEYELGKYQMNRSPDLISEEAEREFHRAALFAAGCHPEYFGEYPVPLRTPRGYTLRHQKLENGVYWLETSQCEEMLSVCYPIWNTEFTSIARVIGEPTEYDYIQGYDKTLGSLFFSSENSCIALYELMQTRPAWSGTLIDKPALMNTIWKNCPKYAVALPQLDETAWKNYLTKVKTERDALIGIYPDAGDDFLLFRKNR